jgi:hypothetical protein
LPSGLGFLLKVHELPTERSDLAPCAPFERQQFSALRARNRAITGHSPAVPPVAPGGLALGSETDTPSERRTEAVHQLPKLRTRVRFPSLAPDVLACQRRIGLLTGRGFETPSNRFGPRCPGVSTQRCPTAVTRRVQSSAVFGGPRVPTQTYMVSLLSGPVPATLRFDTTTLWDERGESDATDGYRRQGSSRKFRTVATGR